MPRRSTNVVFEEDTRLRPPLQYACRGDGGCGVPLMAEDRERHATFHALVSVAASAIVTEDLSEMVRGRDDGD